MSNKIENFIRNVERAYEAKIGYKPEFYIVEIGNGPEIL